METLEGYALLPIEELHESTLNPRKHFDKVALQELALSISAKGILTPLLVRPHGKGFEIGAGHRRLRAAKLAGLGQLPCVVRQMSDADFLELIVVENDQREDVHPLEQAEGYKRLMLLDGYDAKRIAARIGRSEKFVYDRMKLLQLIPLAQQLFLAGRITAGHAILLARIAPKDQVRALEVSPNGYNGGAGGVWTDEGGFGDDELDLQEARREKGKSKDPLAAFDGFKPVSVRELDAWIDQHVRLDPVRVDPVLFPAVAQVVETTKDEPKALLPITTAYHVPDEARDKTVRTFGPQSWKRADGSKGHPTCDFSRPSVIVVGEGRGETFPICLSSNREKCTVHWKAEKKAAEQRRKATASGKSRPVKQTPWERQQEESERRRIREEALRARFTKAIPSILEAGAAAVKKAPIRQLGAVLIASLRGGGKAAELVPLGATPEAILRHAVWRLVAEDSSDTWHALNSLPKILKRFGVDAMAIMEKEQRAEKPEAKAEPKKRAAKK